MWKNTKKYNIHNKRTHKIHMDVENVNKNIYREYTNIGICRQFAQYTSKYK